MAPPPAAADRPGLLHWGPLWITPRFRIGTLGLDTNVFYTATDRQTDFHASGGPGLGIVVPMKAARLLVDGNLAYVYFARTESERRWTGDGRARLELGRGRAHAGIEESYARIFERPTFEVDRRIDSETWTTRADLTIDFTRRTGMRAGASHQELRVPGGQEFFGTDVGRTLSRDVNRASLGLLYRVTPKTAFVVEGDHEQDRFTISPERDADSNRIYGGFELRSPTRLSGHALAGVRLFRPKRGASRTDRNGRYVDVNLAYQFGASTTLSAGHRRDLGFSAFDPAGSTPTVEREDYTARVEKRLFGRLSLWLYGSFYRFTTDGPVTVVGGAGDTTTAVRDDEALQGGADLGYYFRPRLRIGFAATYTERNSTFADFGLEGLLIGGTVSYNPN